MGLASINQTEKYTYADYLLWDDDRRWEIIHGRAYNMTPAPNSNHQLILMEIAFQLKAQLKKNSCYVIPAPFDVRLPLGDEKEEDIANIVQPDISIVCDKHKIDKKGCLGAPDMIIEILSPSTSHVDRMQKFNIYEAAGVKEYWLVSPTDKPVEIFVLGKDKRYGRPNCHDAEETVQPHTMNDIAIDFKQVFSIEI
ncbi:MAG: Uma2 family endonuclease [bacterium]|nr:Uma2 family endonuclease [bacterium]